jgi:hypothetical protein
MHPKLIGTAALKVLYTAYESHKFRPTKIAERLAGR